MANDLASRIGDAQVAVLELVPGEQRFADLSNFVLRGGASRFSPVVLDNERVRYVLPVGIPGEKLHYGTLLLQNSRCALVWRTEPYRPYHALIMELGPATTIAQSPATIRGEVWGRFDLHRAGVPDMTFLVPPVATPALPRMLFRVLVDEPGSTQGTVPLAPLAPAVAQGFQPDPAETSATAAEAAPPAAVPAQAVSALSVPAADPADTQELQAVDRPEPDATTRWQPRRPTATTPAAGAHRATTPASTSASDALYRDEALYRDASRTTPPPAPPTQAVAATTAPVPGLRPVASAAPQPHGPVHVDLQRGGRAPVPDVLKGFLTTFSVTIVVGGLVVLAKALGWLG